MASPPPGLTLTPAGRTGGSWVLAASASAAPRGQEAGDFGGGVGGRTRRLPVGRLTATPSRGGGVGMRTCGLEGAGAGAGGGRGVGGEARQGLPDPPSGAISWLSLPPDPS